MSRLEKIYVISVAVFGVICLFLEVRYGAVMAIVILLCKILSEVRREDD